MTQLISPSSSLRNTLLLIVALGVLVGSTAPAAVQWLVPNDNREAWRLALDRAERTREPIMAFACIEMRQLTVMMDTQTFEQLDVDKALRDFLCVRVDAVKPENRTFLDHYEVGKRRLDFETRPPDNPNAPRSEVEIEEAAASTYPVTLFISPDGVLEHVVYGFVIPEDFLQMLGSVKEIMDTREEMKRKGEDARALARLGARYVELQRYAAGREVLERALELDADGKLGVAETALLDLAVAHMAAGEHDKAIQAIAQHTGQYPDSDLRCKAHFLLGGALLASVEEDRLTVEEPEAATTTQEIAQARERLNTGRLQAVEAWSWFLPPEGGEAPCKDTEWAQYSLGALQELQAEIAYESVRLEVTKLVEDGKIDAAVQALRQFAEQHPHTDRGCEALFDVGQILLEAGKRAEALAQWRKLTETDPEKNPCAGTIWRGQAMEAIQENER